METAQKLTIRISEEFGSVSALLQKPEGSLALMVLAHGAGAGMDHPFMEMLAGKLAEKGIATLRFNFIYMEKGAGPDRPKKAHAALRAVLEMASQLSEGLPLLLGGKSYGGRMSSLLAAEEGLPEVKGLVYFGFPLHAPGKPGMDRATHLSEIQIPQLFLQGTRDKLAQFELIEEVVEKLEKGSLVKMEGGDHSFKTLKKSGISHEESIELLAAETLAFFQKINS